MLARLLTIWEKIRTSLWFFPALLALGAVPLAWMALGIQFEIVEGDSAVWWLHGGSAQDAAELLSSLLTSLITMATLVVSITMVVLTLAAGQLGPRLIRSFMADSRTQIVIGFFLATIVYLVLVLRTLHEDMPEVPHIAVTLGTVLLLLCVLVLLFFIHHLARSIIADTVIQRVGADLDTAIRRLLPEQHGVHDLPVHLSMESMQHAVVSLPRGGYVQAVDHESLVKAAQHANAVVGLRFRPGHHLLPGGRHVHVTPVSALTETLETAIRDGVIVGSDRTASQDLEFSIRQLVEVALRAISPGINDPYTAVAALDRLGLSIALVMRRPPARGTWRDDAGMLRVTAPAPSFEGIVDAAFNQIRQSGEAYPAILIHLLDVLAQLAEQARSAEQQAVLSKHIRMIADAGHRTINEPQDLAALEERRATARERLRGAHGEPNAIERPH